MINIKKEVAELSKMESLINQGFKNVTVGLKEVADLLTEISTGAQEPERSTA